MAFAHPANFYIRYLLLALPDPSRGEVNKQLELYSLAPVQAPQYADIVGRMSDTPVGFRMHDRKHRSSAGWLKAMRIHSLVHRDDVVQKMFKWVLSNRRLREILERLLLGNVTPMESAYRLRDLGFRIPDLAVAEFGHYFWNTECMGVADWAAYFSSDASKGRTGALQDGYWAALHGGPQLALYRSGISVELNSKDILEEVRDELVFTFREVRDLPLSSKKVEMLGIVTRNLIKVDERLSASDAALQDVLRRFEKFRVGADSSEIPSLIDLAPSGSVSDTSRTEILRSRER